jgi:hypothetical protein
MDFKYTSKLLLLLLLVATVSKINLSGANNDIVINIYCVREQTPEESIWIKERKRQKREEKTA